MNNNETLNKSLNSELRMLESKEDLQHMKENKYVSLYFFISTNLPLKRKPGYSFKKVI